MEPTHELTDSSRGLLALDPEVQCNFGVPPQGDMSGEPTGCSEGAIDGSGRLGLAGVSSGYGPGAPASPMGGSPSGGLKEEEFEAPQPPSGVPPPLGQAQSSDPPTRPPRGVDVSGPAEGPLGLMEMAMLSHYADPSLQPQQAPPADGQPQAYSHILDGMYHSYLGSHMAAQQGGGQDQPPAGDSRSSGLGDGMTSSAAKDASLYHQAHVAAAAAQHQQWDRFGFAGVGSVPGNMPGSMPGNAQGGFGGMMGHHTLAMGGDLKGQNMLRQKKGGRTEPVPQSGFKGVSWNSRMKAWLAFYVTENGERKSKTFSTRKLGMEEARLQAITFCREKQEQRREARKRGAGVGNLMDSQSSSILYGGGLLTRSAPSAWPTAASIDPRHGGTIPGLHAVLGGGGYPGAPM